MAKEKIDKGFAVFYWNLSDRRKFKRTLWTAPWIIIAVLLYYRYTDSVSEAGIVAVVLLLIYISQLVVTYRNWKNGASVQKTSD